MRSTGSSSGPSKSTGGAKRVKDATGEQMFSSRACGIATPRPMPVEARRSRSKRPRRTTFSSSPLLRAILIAIFDKADCFPFVTRSSEMSSSDKMGEIIRVKPPRRSKRKRQMSVQPRCLGRSRNHFRMKLRSWPSRTRSQDILASGLMARFEAFRHSPEIEVKNMHSSLKVVKDFSKSSKPYAI